MYPKGRNADKSSVPNYENYVEEYFTLLNMFRCALAYLNSKEHVESNQDEMDIKMEHDIHMLFCKYRDKLEKKCFKHTGKSIHDSITSQRCQ